MYWAHCTCKKSHSSIIVLVCGPFPMASSMATLTSMISWSFTVKSSSLLPPPESMATEGRMGTGGTRRVCRIKFSGRPMSGSSQRISQSSSVMRWNKSNTRVGSKSSTAVFNAGLRSLLRLMADCRFCTKSSISSSMALPLYFSWTIFKVLTPWIFFTVPFAAWQCGQLLDFLHLSNTFLKVAPRARTSVRGCRILRKCTARSASLSSTRAQVLQMDCSKFKVCLKNPI
mmetsp:Transcript_50542/g.59018  ORF Transcript_50542/g.59018 Transcript_50542/m.59018 type:complete len:229 (-) Transcript_50542:548-1234(-)